VLLGTFIASGAMAWHEGYRLYAVKTGSMTPGLPVGSLLIDAPPSPPYHRGDVVTVERPQDQSNPLVTHRVFAVGPLGGIRTKGDANPEPDVFVAKPSNVVGEVVQHVPYGGYVLVYLSQWTGVLSLMTVALTLWLAWSLFFPTAGSASAKKQKSRSTRLRVPRQRQAVLAGDPVRPAAAVPAPDPGVPVPASLSPGSADPKPDRIPAQRDRSA
jgi:signal peptidase